VVTGFMQTGKKIDVSDPLKYIYEPKSKKKKCK